MSKFDQSQTAEGKKEQRKKELERDRTKAIVVAE